MVIKLAPKACFKSFLAFLIVNIFYIILKQPFAMICYLSLALHMINQWSNENSSHHWHCWHLFCQLMQSVQWWWMQHSFCSSDRIYATFDCQLSTNDTILQKNCCNCINIQMSSHDVGCIFYVIPSILLSFLLSVIGMLSATLK